MRKESRRWLAGTAAAGAAALILWYSAAPAGIVFAYPVGGTPPDGGYAVPSAGGSGMDFQSLLAPLTEFFQSIGSAGRSGAAPQFNLSAPVLPSGLGLPNLPTYSMPNMLSAGNNLMNGGGVQGAIQNGLQQFDAWLYGIAGFHILSFLSAALGIFSWLLGAAKQLVDWLSGIIRA